MTRYVGNYAKFQEVLEAKKAQEQAAYNKQQNEIADLKDFVARNKARVATRNMAMSRQKKLDKMEIIELASEKPKPRFNFKEAGATGRRVLKPRIWSSVMMNPCLNIEFSDGAKTEDCFKGHQRHR